MNIAMKLGGATLAACMMFAASAMADDVQLQPAPVAVQQAQNIEPAKVETVLPAPAQVAAITVPSAARTPAAPDGLRTDMRWPAMKDCIENTKTPAEFQTCLQTVFLTDTTGMAAMMLGK
jgi:hypothetical protein